MMSSSKCKSVSKIVSFILLQFVILILVFPNSNLKVYAESATSIYIEDNADIFTLSEEEMLSKEMKELQEKYDLDVVILTVDDRGNISATGYLDSYLDNQYDKGLLSEDAILCLRDINDRWIEIMPYGKAATYITETRVDTILDNMTSDLRNDQYFKAYQIYLDDLDNYLGKHPNPLTWTWVQVLIGMVIGGIITAIMVSGSGGRTTTNSRTYLDQTNSGLVAKRDMYITTTVQRIRKPQASSGGGGGSRRTPGGHSAGSGGGRRI